MSPSGISLEKRLARVDWDGARDALENRGVAMTRPVLTPAECSRLRETFDDLSLFRESVDLRRFGAKGTYRYFKYPLPPLIQTLRSELYRALLPIARGWTRRLQTLRKYPPQLDDLLGQGNALGQTLQTCVLLRYGEGEFNSMHRDVYGGLDFPLQAAISLSRAGHDFRGGEFVTVQQAKGSEPWPEVLAPIQGALILFPNHDRPARGRQRNSIDCQHGVSRILQGTRYTLGLVFTDAKVT